MLRARGVLSQKEICQTLAISQSTFSRAIQDLVPDEILRFGEARKTVYAAKRAVSDVGDSITVLLIDQNGKARTKGTLHGIFPSGFMWVSEEGSRFETFKDLPYFLDDLRPQGFLGRLVPRLYPELGYPTDIRNWSGDHTLGYLTRHGFDTMGQILLGDRALILYDRAKKSAEENQITKNQRASGYPRFASETLEKGSPGSSAAGEQPKFTCHLELSKDRPTSMIVKFSPQMKESVGRRIADLLVCEHLALTLLQKAGIPTSTSSLFEFKGQMFLEVERFDRTASGGRRGMISLNALNLEFVANTGSWTDVARDLNQKRIITKDSLQLISRLDLFGELIANSDRHNGNLSFFFDDFQVGTLTPVYDMLPMLYMPQQGQVIERKYAPQPPQVAQLPFWSWAQTLAKDYWEQISKESRVSKEMQKIAAENKKKLSLLKY
ncbi:MAG: type II toxin-antitoxin system HipA family toxin YjjJ [Bdellovibrionales bacterium]|nr:type II toxin-antitoxin system HipA family toxin YjjJ [Bdellovibrionales bacterium]